MWGQISRTQSITLPFKTVPCPSPVGSQHYRGAARHLVSGAAGRRTGTRHRVAAVLLLVQLPCCCLLQPCCCLQLLCCCLLLFAAALWLFAAVVRLFAAVILLFSAVVAPHWTCSSGQSQKRERSMQVLSTVLLPKTYAVITYQNVPRDAWSGQSTVTTHDKGSSLHQPPATRCAQSTARQSPYTAAAHNKEWNSL